MGLAFGRELVSITEGHGHRKGQGERGREAEKGQKPPSAHTQEEPGKQRRSQRGRENSPGRGDVSPPRGQGLSLPAVSTKVLDTTAEVIVKQ